MGRTVVLTHLGLVSHICVLKNSSHFPSDAYMRHKSLYISYRPRGRPTKQCPAMIYGYYYKLWQLYGPSQCVISGVAILADSILHTTSYSKISQNLEGARLVARVFQLLWNLAGASAALLPRRLRNFKAIWASYAFETLQDLTIRRFMYRSPVRKNASAYILDVKDVKIQHPAGAEIVILRETSIQKLLMPWFMASPRHQQLGIASIM